MTPKELKIMREIDKEVKAFEVANAKQNELKSCHLMHLKEEFMNLKSISKTL